KNEQRFRLPPSHAIFSFLCTLGFVPCLGSGCDHVTVNFIKTKLFPENVASRILSSENQQQQPHAQQRQRETNPPPIRTWAWCRFTSLKLHLSLIVDAAVTPFYRVMSPNFAHLFGFLVVYSALLRTAVRVLHQLRTRSKSLAS
ncbi:unnamed protein product, partial [Ectocarpus sp. 4 AP-2014]